MLAKTDGGYQVGQSFRKYLCGGAALTRHFVENDLREAYSSGPVYYGADAFSGLHIMDVAPTVLKLLGLRVPEDMEGKVIGG